MGAVTLRRKTKRMEFHRREDSGAFPRAIQSALVHIDSEEDNMMPYVTRKVRATQNNVQLFPLTPEAVRRLRDGEEDTKVPMLSARCDDLRTTHADDLLRTLLSQ